MSLQAEISPQGLGQLPCILCPSSLEIPERPKRNGPMIDTTHPHNWANEREEEHWDQITLLFDPETKKKNVKGRITASVAEILDVCLKSLNNNEERHYMALKSDYPQETRRFEESERGRLLTIKAQPKESLKGRLKSDIKIPNYSCADQPYPDANREFNFWDRQEEEQEDYQGRARTTYCETKEFKGKTISTQQAKYIEGGRAATPAPTLTRTPTSNPTMKWQTGWSG